jgi:hypothetical protein
MTCKITLRASGFDISGVARNSKGDVSFPSLKEAILRFLDVPYPAPHHLREAALKRSGSSAGELIDTNSFSYTGCKKHGRATLARWTGFTEKELWPYASGSTLEKARIDIALADNTATEPLDPLSPSPDLPLVQRRAPEIFCGLDLAEKPDVSVEADCAVDGDRKIKITNIRKVGSITLPQPTQPWMGDLHRAFSASPADTSNAALRKRVAELEAQLATRAKADLAAEAYYNGGAAADYPGRFDAIHFIPEMAAPLPYVPPFTGGVVDALLAALGFIRRVGLKINPLSRLLMALVDLQEHGLKQSEALADRGAASWKHKGQRFLWRVLIGAPTPEAEAMSTPAHALAAPSRPSQNLQGLGTLNDSIARLHRSVSEITGHPPHFREEFCAPDQAQPHSEAPQIHGLSRETPSHICTCSFRISPDDSAQISTADFMDEMATWAPFYEERAPGRLRQFANCLKAIATRFGTTSAQA